MAILVRIGLLGLVTAATISVSLAAPLGAQNICYRPDGSMYAGAQPPADCSPTRPKSRDEAIRRDRDAAVQAARSISEEAARKAREEAVIEAEVSRQVELGRNAKVEAIKAQRAIKSCEAYKHRPSWMDEEQAALCYHVWADKARKTLGR